MNYFTSKKRGLRFIVAFIAFFLLSNSSVQRFVSDGIIPNRDYPSGDVGKIISPQLGQRHLNQPFVFNGYAILCGNGVHEIWDISDPYDPDLKKTFSSKHTKGEGESHQMSMHRDENGKYLLVTISGRGLDIWDMTDTLNPEYINDIILPGVNYGDVDGAVWGVSWQGNYIYAGSTNRGVQVIDVSNLNNPKIVANVGTNQMSGVKAGPLFALGDVLVVTAPKQNGGVATIDISNPEKPLVLDSDKESSTYIGGFYGKHAVLINPVRFYDVTTNPSNIKKVASINTQRSEYVAFDEGKLFLGSLRGGDQGVHIYDINDLPNMPKIRRIRGRDKRWDDQFACPVGNLLIITDDQRVNGKYVGGVLAVHEKEKDVSGPEVITHFPKKDETNVGINSSIGLSFSDWIEFKSVDENSIIVRPAQGGAPVKVSTSWLYTTLNITPESPLQNNTVYEVVLKTDGITDLVGNPMEKEYKFLFSTGASIDVDTIESPVISGNDPVKITEPITWIIQNPSDEANYVWTVEGTEIGSGTSIAPDFDEIGRYQACVKVFRKDPIDPDGGELVENKCFLQVIHNNTDTQPESSTTIVLQDTFVWNVNPDASTVTKTNITTNTKISEVEVGKTPKSIAVVNDEIWVANRDSHSISRLDPDGSSRGTINLPYASQPVAIINSPDKQFVYVSLSARSEVLKLNAGTGAVVGEISFKNGLEIPEIGALAMNGAGTKLYVARFISKGIDGGEIYEVDPTTMSLIKTVVLASSTTPDASEASRGIPNYITSITISPDGKEMWAASKKDNLERGSFRDGNVLNEVNTVRAITSRINLSTGTENLDARMDIDNSERCNSVTFSNLGDLAFITMPGNELVSIIDTATGSKLSEFKVGKVPDGAVFNADNGSLYVHNFLSRSLTVVDLTEVLLGSGLSKIITEVDVVANEPLSPLVLKGKQIFYDAASKKLNKSGYMSCASCHLDGGHDGQTWDFTSLGEGFRNTIDLRGRAGTGHGRLHWTANFDEIHDFENQIRTLGAGDGLMSNGNFSSSEDPFGRKKAGLSEDLDALAAYITSLLEVPDSPYRNANGTLTAQGEAGKVIFNRENCFSCHAGTKFTDSPSGKLHAIGTLKPSSGNRITEPITGFDTPTLKGIWNTAPYLHDGSANTIEEAIEAHSLLNVSLSPSELKDLASYIQQLDENESLGTSGNQAPLVSFVKPASSITLSEGGDLGVEVEAIDRDGSIVEVNLYLDNTLIRKEGKFPYHWGTSSAGEDDNDLLNMQPGEYELKAVAIDDNGAESEVVMMVTVVPSINGSSDFQSINDAYLQNGTNNNTEELRVQNGDRVSYLMFDISELPTGAEIKEVILSLQVFGDAGNGNIRVYQTTNNWQETTINGTNAPSTGNEITSLDTVFEEGKTYEFDVSTADFSQGQVSFVLEMEVNGNDVSFASKESQGGNAPGLKVNYINNTLSIGEISDAAKVNVYPNPVQNHLHISGASIGGQVVQVYDVTGSLKTSKLLENKEHRIDMSSFSPGLYFVKISNPNTTHRSKQTRTYKVIKNE